MCCQFVRFVEQTYQSDTLGKDQIGDPDTGSHGALVGGRKSCPRQRRVTSLQTMAPRGPTKGEEVKIARVIGLVAFVALALTATSVSAAQASTEFHCASIVTKECVFKSTPGSNDNVFEFGGANVKCKERVGVPGARLQGYGPKATTTLDLRPFYGGCTMWGVGATVTTEGCVFRYHLTGASSPYAVSTDIVCEPGKAIVMSAPSLPCTVTIGSQSGLSGVSMTNVAGTPSKLSMAINLTGMTFTASQVGCPTKAGTYSDMKLYGSNLLGAYESVEGEQYNEVGLSIF